MFDIWPLGSKTNTNTDLIQPLMASVGVRSEAVVRLLYVYCLSFNVGPDICVFCVLSLFWNSVLT